MNESSSAKVIEFEDYEIEIARLSSLTFALIQSQQRKDALQIKLESLIKVREESLRRVNELDELRRRLEERKVLMARLAMKRNIEADAVKRRLVEVGGEIGVLLGSAKKIVVATKRLKEADRLLAGERGRAHLDKLLMRLGMRTQRMVAQVSALYPVKSTIGQADEGKLELMCVGNASGSSAECEPLNPASLTILGLQLSSLPLKNSFFSDKKVVQSSASALGYIAHAVKLIASYLDVHLRYYLHLGGSRSYIRDSAPSIELSYSDSPSNLLSHLNSKPTDFPLFLEGQDTTKATYAIFLLNKDIEQLLNFIGEQSLGPRHVLANLKELYRVIHSAK